MATELERVVAGARDRLKELKARYPRLDAWLVLALREHQVDVPSDLAEILVTFPGVFSPSVHRRAAEPLAKRIVEADRQWVNLTNAERRVRHELVAKLAPLGAKLGVSSDVLVELRFKTLEYALVAELRQDSLVDMRRTPRTAASIRIVLGTARGMGRLDEGHATRRPRDREESRLPLTPFDDGNTGGG